MGRIEKQEARISANLGTKNLAVTKGKLKTYLRYLKGHLEFPVKVKGIEDFEWEEYYVFGPGGEREYEQLKKTNPSYTDTFNLVGLVEEVEDWGGILAKCVRLSDKKRFTLPLADLRATDKSSKIMKCWMTTPCGLLTIDRGLRSSRRVIPRDVREVRNFLS